MDWRPEILKKTKNETKTKNRRRGIYIAIFALSPDCTMRYVVLSSDSWTCVLTHQAPRWSDSLLCDNEPSFEDQKQVSLGKK